MCFGFQPVLISQGIIYPKMLSINEIILLHYLKDRKKLTLSMFIENMQSDLNTFNEYIK